MVDGVGLLVGAAFFAVADLVALRDTLLTHLTQASQAPPAPQGGKASGSLPGERVPLGRGWGLPGRVTSVPHLIVTNPSLAAASMLLITLSIDSPPR